MQGPKAIQLNLSDSSSAYQEFVEKFKSKKTTDDCYTPDVVYGAVRDWVVDEYGLEGLEVVRPFWPGGDFERHEYPEGCVVIDNPPFSLLAKIIRTYKAWGVRFFLFAPALTLFSSNEEVCFIVANATITYENGAAVNTSFITNLDSVRVRTAPTLRRAINDAQAKDTVELPKYEYPATVISAARLGKIADVDFSVTNCHFIRALEHQRKNKKTIFGAGFLISDLKAAELKAAELKAAELKAARETIEWSLSSEEQKVVEHLNEKEKGGRDVQDPQQRTVPPV